MTKLSAIDMTLFLSILLNVNLPMSNKSDAEIFSSHNTSYCIFQNLLAIPEIGKCNDPPLLNN
jgi:hypothetical protein